MKHKFLFLFLAIFFIILNVADIWTTSTLLTLKATEANGIAIFLFNSVGFFGASIMKMSISIFLTFLLVTFPRLLKKENEKTMNQFSLLIFIVLNGLFIFAVINNLICIANTPRP